jgi:hypothetical protein
MQRAMGSRRRLDAGRVGSEFIDGIERGPRETGGAFWLVRDRFVE